MARMPVGRLRPPRWVWLTRPCPSSHPLLRQRHPALGLVRRLAFATSSSHLPGSHFQDLVGPPPPFSFAPPKLPKRYYRATRWSRRLLYLCLVLGAAYLADRQLWASGLQRSLGTFGTGLLVALDYKLNFRAQPLPLIGAEGSIHALHARNAERLFELIRGNGGLYIKIGQAIAMQSAVLPPEFQKMFARMFDDAPQDPWEAVEKVIRDDFGGRSVEDVFGVSFTGAAGQGVMETTARASASVAQVHWARLEDGREVAVKIQKPEIAQQIGWDLWSFKLVTWAYTWWFDLPLYRMVPFITERLELETDFENEARNSETMRKLVASEPRLGERVYIPRVYPELSSRRVLVTEWIEGVRLWDREALTKPWAGGHGKGSPGAHGAKLCPPPDMDNARRVLREHGPSQILKPERSEWRGPAGKGGLGASQKDIMRTMIDLFSAQIFKWGIVHCDPHPGNIFIRRLPSGKAELVLIDHGLYVHMTEKFRHEYSVFWKALLGLDNKAIADVTAQWGINVKGADLFASATLMRPYDGGGGHDVGKRVFGDAETQTTTPSQRSYEMQRRMKEGIRDILGEDDKWPQELIFIGRNMRIVQGNNQMLGSPVNRVKLMGEWASRSLFEDPNLPLRIRVNNAMKHVVFTAVLTLTDLAFYWFKLRQWLGLGGGMEDEVEARMKDMAKDYGIELQHDVFEG